MWWLLWFYRSSLSVQSQRMAAAEILVHTQDHNQEKDTKCGHVTNNLCEFPFLAMLMCDARELHLPQWNPGSAFYICEITIHLNWCTKSFVMLLHAYMWICEKAARCTDSQPWPLYIKVSKENLLTQVLLLVNLYLTKKGKDDRSVVEVVWLHSHRKFSEHVESRK